VNLGVKGKILRLQKGGESPRRDEVKRKISVRRYETQKGIQTGEMKSHFSPHYSVSHKKSLFM